MKQEKLTYRCNKCDYKIKCTLEEAVKHINVPIDSPLPIGVVWKDSEYPLFMYIPSDSQSKIKQADHSLDQECIFSRYEDGAFREGTMAVNSKIIKRLIKSGNARLLTFEEFEDFRQRFSKVSYLRMTSPGLEALAREK